MTRCSLKLHAWPDTDRQMWDRLTMRAGLLDDGGRGAHWATETRHVVARDYGYWLQYLLVTEPDLLATSPASRLTPERVRAYCQSMGNVCALTKAGRIARLLAVIRNEDERNNWVWLAKMRAALERAARRQGPVRQKVDRIRSSGHLFEVGLAQLTAADQGVGLHPRLQAEQFRDGLMVALLAARPLRIKNFSALRLGDHVRETSDGYSIYVPGEETKTGHPLDLVVPDRLVTSIQRYLRHYRPILLGGRRSDFLWVHRGGSGYTPGSLGMRIGLITERLVGVRLSPHLFRDCAATTIATEDPEHVMTIAPILGHSSPKTAERHYNQARSLEASRRYQHSIRELRDRARPRRRIS